jgi:YegS/Rv2252/BmrU family lipid kinase
VNNEVKKVLFIINKYAGTGFRPELEGKIIEMCQSHDIECNIEFTQSRGHATELARSAADQNFQRVIAVGGDGTVNEVAQGLLNTSVEMGIIPRGSGNGLARHLGIPISIMPAIKNIFNSYALAMDTFTVNGHLSLNVSGIGFDGHIANLFGNTKKRGLPGYIKLTVQEFFRFKEFEATINIDDKIFDKKAFIIAIANSSQYGNNARIAPAASVCDQLLHITILKKVPPHRVDFVYSFFAGKIERSSYCEIITSNKFTIDLSKPVSFHIDGEPSGTSKSFTIALQPTSLNILVPNNSGIKP